MKKTLSLLLAVLMLVSVLAACGGGNTETKPSETNPDSTGSSQAPNTNGIAPDTYTYNTYSSALATNWNPHTWEMNADSALMSYIEVPLVDISIKDSESGEYQWIFVGATAVTDVTKDHQDDLTKYNVTLPAGKTAADIEEGYVYEIKLRPEMCWEDGTPINADTYIYSAKQLLDPDMKNYRANLYYSGESAIAGANEYYFSKDEGVYTPYATDYASLDAAVEALGDGLMIDVWGFWGAQGYIDAEGNECPQYVSVTDETAYSADGAGEDEFSGAALFAAYNAYFQVGVGYEGYVAYYKTNESFGFTWDGVGIYKVDDYTIRYVCDAAYDYYYFLTSCTSNWIVHEELYESCKEYYDDGTYKGNKYGTSKDTTMSYGAYKMASLEDDKQIVMVQNEKYFEYSIDDNGNLYSTTEKIGLKVDGEFQPQYLTQKVIINKMDDDAAKLAFLAGELDDWTPSAEDAVKYSTSEQLYKVDETYTMRLFFHTNLESLKEMDAAGNVNSVVMSNDTFRKAMSLAIDRADFVTATAGYKPAYAVLNSLYFYDVYNDPASIYRNTDQAMQAICNVYGVEYGEGTPYATLEEAYKSINGLNLTEAKALFTQACDELVEAGLYTKGEPIKIQMGWMAGAHDSSSQKQVTLLNQHINAALEGTGFGTIELVGIDNLSNRYNDVINGVYAIGYGAWGGAAFYPFRNFQVYCDPDQYAIHEAGSWDPTTETLTLSWTNDNGETVEDTMTWQQWSGCMVGTGKYANESNEVKLQLLAGMEENIIEKYIFIPLATSTACSMLSYKTSYYTENYSIMYGFGGMRLMKYNYTNAEWTEYVDSQDGKIGY